MEKINNEYTFTEAAEKMVDFLKLMGDLDKDFKLPDPAECLIDELERRKKLLVEFNKLQKEYEEQTKKYAKAISRRNELLVKNNDLEKLVTELTDKNKKLNEKCKQLKQEKNLKLSLSESLDKSEKSDVTLSNTFISSLAASYEKSEKEKEREHEKVVEANKKVLQLTEEKDKLTEENELLHQKVATREREIESLNEYIKSLESRL